MSIIDNQIETNVVLKETQQNHTKWTGWYKTLTNLNFKEDVAKAYATISVNNTINFSTMYDLNNELIQSLGINKAGHRTQTLSMKPTFSLVSTPSTTNIEHCSQHLDTKGINKCYRCKGMMCSDCQNQLTLGPSIITYCEKCIDQISCTIQ